MNGLDRRSVRRSVLIAASFMLRTPFQYEDKRRKRVNLSRGKRVNHVGIRSNLETCRA